MRDKAEKYLDALRRALEKADGLDVIFDKHMKNRTGKYIVFCSILAHMREMMEKAGEWFSSVEKTPHVYYTYSDDLSTDKARRGYVSESDETYSCKRTRIAHAISIRAVSY